jgi:hypothetical protein
MRSKEPSSLPCLPQSQQSPTSASFVPSTTIRTEASTSDSKITRLQPASRANRRPSQVPPPDSLLLLLPEVMQLLTPTSVITPCEKTYPIVAAPPLLILLCSLRGSHHHNSLLAHPPWVPKGPHATEYHNTILLSAPCIFMEVIWPCPRAQTWMFYSSFFSDSSRKCEQSCTPPAHGRLFLLEHPSPHSLQ